MKFQGQLKMARKNANRAYSILNFGYEQRYLKAKNKFHSLPDEDKLLSTIRKEFSLADSQWFFAKYNNEKIACYAALLPLGIYGETISEIDHLIKICGKFGNNEYYAERICKFAIENKKLVKIRDLINSILYPHYYFLNIEERTPFVDYSTIVGVDVRYQSEYMTAWQKKK